MRNNLTARADAGSWDMGGPGVPEEEKRGPSREHWGWGNITEIPSTTKISFNDRHVQAGCASWLGAPPGPQDA